MSKLIFIKNIIRSILTIAVQRKLLNLILQTVKGSAPEGATENQKMELSA